MIRRWICAILVVAMAASLWLIAARTPDPLYGAVDESVVANDKSEIAETPNELTFWYTDDTLTEYLQSVGMLFQKETGIKVNFALKSGVEFLEYISEVSVTDSNMRGEPLPDLYITSHDNLLRAYLSGIAAEVADPNKIMIPAVYPRTALNAVSCYDKYVAYPLYYETNFFLYNKTYMASIAQSKIEGESDRAEGIAATEELEKAGETPEESEILNTEEDKEDTKESDDTNDKSDDEEENSADSTTDIAEEDGESVETDAENIEEADPMGDEDAEVSQEVLDQLATMIPSTIGDITTFANNYDAPEEVESVFKWDVTDIFYNYFFVGHYMEVGGSCGDDAGIFNIYNPQAVECLQKFQSMNQFFMIDTEHDNYSKILQDFIDGKMVFTVATTDAIARIAEAKKEGKFNFEYGVTTLPNVSDLLKSQGLSVTETVVINGYSQKQAEANRFASYLAAGKANNLYKMAQKVSCCINAEYDDDEIKKIMDEYERSIPLPKMVEAANYWVQLEIAFSKVWNGADPDETLQELSETMGSQIEKIRAKLPTQESFKAGGGGFF